MFRFTLGFLFGFGIALCGCWIQRINYTTVPAHIYGRVIYFKSTGKNDDLHAKLIGEILNRERDRRTEMMERRNELGLLPLPPEYTP